jgi:hypothetical protein
MELQIYAVAALWMAAKYECSAAPSVSIFISVAYAKRTVNMTQLRTEVIAAEVVLMQAIDYRLSLPTIKTFLRSIMYRHHLLLPKGSLDKPLYFLCSYLSEVALLHHKTGRAFQPEQQLQMASAVYNYALVLLKRPLGHAHTVTLCQLEQLYGATYVLVETHRLITRNPCAVWVKYADPLHHCVAIIPPVTLQQIAAMACCPSLSHGSSMLQCGEALPPPSPACSSTTAVAEAVMAA